MEQLHSAFLTNCVPLGLRLSGPSAHQSLGSIPVTLRYPPTPFKKKKMSVNYAVRSLGSDTPQHTWMLLTPQLLSSLM